MRLDSIRLRNFRGIKDLTLGLDETLTVLVGENGVGKTSLLDASSFALHALRSFWPENAQRVHYAPHIEPSDIAIDQSEFSIHLRASYNGIELQRTVLDFDLCSRRDFSAKSISKLSNSGFSQFQTKPVHPALICLL